MDLMEALSSTPQTKRVLAEKMGCSTRDVEVEIQEARLEGFGIISGSDGYSITVDPALIRACAKRLRSRALNQLQTASALERAADKMPMTLFGDAA